MFDEVLLFAASGHGDFHLVPALDAQRQVGPRGRADPDTVGHARRWLGPAARRAHSADGRSPFRGAPAGRNELGGSEGAELFRRFAHPGIVDHDPFARVQL